MCARDAPCALRHMQGWHRIRGVRNEQQKCDPHVPCLAGCCQGNISTVGFVSSLLCAWPVGMSAPELCLSAALYGLTSKK